MVAGSWGLLILTIHDVIVLSFEFSSIFADLELSLVLLAQNSEQEFVFK